MLIAAPASPGDADSVRRRLEAAFEDPVMLDGHELRLTASIGRAAFPEDADSADGLLRHADASMFEAKRGFVGRDEEGGAGSVGATSDRPAAVAAEI